MAIPGLLGEVGKKPRETRTWGNAVQAQLTTSRQEKST